MQFHNKNNFYSFSIYIDKNGNNQADKSDYFFTDPLSSFYFSGLASVGKKSILFNRYLKKGIKVSISGACGGRQIVFDRFGRLLCHNLQKVKEIRIKLLFEKEKREIIIKSF